MFGSRDMIKDCLEYVCFENHLSDEYGRWRLHGKVILYSNVFIYNGFSHLYAYNLISKMCSLIKKLSSIQFHTRMFHSQLKNINQLFES